MWASRQLWTALLMCLNVVIAMPLCALAFARPSFDADLVNVQKGTVYDSFKHELPTLLVQDDFGHIVPRMAADLTQYWRKYAADHARVHRHAITRTLHSLGAGTDDLSLIHQRANGAQLYLGAYPHADTLQKYGITHVLSIVNHPDKPHWNLDNVHTQWLHLDDSEQENMLEELGAATKWIRAAAEVPNARILVHCHMGISRSATVVIAYMMRYYGMTREVALRHVRTRRPIVNPNKGFYAQLSAWQARLASPAPFVPYLCAMK